MTELFKGTWIVVADGEKALFFENMTDAENPNLRIISVEQPEQSAEDLRSSDRAGRRADGGPRQKSAMEETDWHRLSKDRFAHDLAGILYAKAHAGEYDRLVLVAGPYVMGQLRQQLHKEVSDKVVAEIDKTLTNHPMARLEPVLLRELAAA